MEIVVIGILGFFLGFNSNLTVVHQECLRDNKAACEVEQKINPYIEKK